ncbi:hypothetical protein TNCV_89271 [Trichonephila clavipes]|nr:hypothetical protein TNCV_89271 [Trichonephila clavipes]
MVLKANDRRTSCPCHDEFRGPRSDYVRQWYWARTRDKESHDPIPIPLGYHGLNLSRFKLSPVGMMRKLEERGPSSVVILVI